MTELKEFYITFGQKYRHEEHPVFGMVPTLPDQWVKVLAQDEQQARSVVNAFLGTSWSGLYEWADLIPHYYPSGEYAIFYQAGY